MQKSARKKSGKTSKTTRKKGSGFAQMVLLLLAGGAIVLGLIAAYVVVILTPNLPSLESLTDYQPKMPLRVYTADQVLIGEFGQERRDFVPIKDMPKVMKDAVLAIEDDRFYEHGGVDFIGVLRAALANVINSRSQGASTITMQVARNFFLSREKTYLRKIQEMLLAYKIEETLSKDQILELYMNQIYLGERAYGFGTAERVYFGKPISEITVAEAAMLAGLPKAPATGNPKVNPKRATQRQQYILKRMNELGYITNAQYEQALQEKLPTGREVRRFGTHAEHAAELVRQAMYAQYKEETYTRGLNVYTTLNSSDQEAAYRAVRQGVLDYDRRHGYRGPEAFIELPKDAEDREQAIDDILLKHPDSDDLRSAVVTAASAKAVQARTVSGEDIEITGEGLRFAASALSPKAAAKTAIRPGAVIRVAQDVKKKWFIMQLPEVAAAFVSLNAQDGSYRAMVGGFDFTLNQFDHVSQAWRQPGSSIKPFIYSAALERGFSPSTLVNDAPLGTDNPDGAPPKWDPRNDDDKYDGAVSIRTGLKRSKNLVSIRLLRQITPGFARAHLTNFGFEADKQPDNLTLALGTGSVTPLQLATAYTVFANGGFQVTPYLIDKVTDAHGNVLSQAQPVIAGDEAARVLDARNAFVMDSMMRDVVNGGTAYAASQKLGRNDLAGKTGTTSDAMDGWFGGYGGDIVAVAWMGYDQPKTLGGREYGSTLALPMWIDYMRVALRGKGPFQRPVPQGLVQENDDWMYAEYANGGGVASVGMEEGGTDPIRSFLSRILGGGSAQPAPAAPSTVPPQQPASPPAPSRQRQDDSLYRGGGGGH